MIMCDAWCVGADAGQAVCKAVFTELLHSAWCRWHAAPRLPPLRLPRLTAACPPRPAPQQRMDAHPVLWHPGRRPCPRCLHVRCLHRRSQASRHRRRRPQPTPQRLTRAPAACELRRPSCTAGNLSRCHFIGPPTPAGFPLSCPLLLYDTLLCHACIPLLLLHPFRLSQGTRSPRHERQHRGTQDWQRHTAAASGERSARGWSVDAATTAGAREQMAHDGRSTGWLPPEGGGAWATRTGGDVERRSMGTELLVTRTCQGRGGAGQASSEAGVEVAARLPGTQGDVQHSTAQHSTAWRRTWPPGGGYRLAPGGCSGVPSGLGMGSSPAAAALEPCSAAATARSGKGIPAARAAIMARWASHTASLSCSGMAVGGGLRFQHVLASPGGGGMQAPACRAQPARPAPCCALAA